MSRKWAEVRETLSEVAGLVERASADGASGLLPTGEGSGLEADLLGRLEHLRQALTDHRIREADLIGLNRTVLQIADNQDSGAILAEIVRQARRLIRSDVSYLSVYDERDACYVAKVSDNALTSHFENLRMSVSQGVLSHIITNLEPFFTTDYRQDNRFAHDPVVDEAFREEQIVGMLGVPLQLRGRVMGAFFVADRRPRIYQPREIAILGSLASHAALALENARLLEDARVANVRIEEQRRATTTAAVAHDQMTDLVARGGSVEDLARLAADRLDGSVSVLSPVARVLFASDAPPLGQAPAGAILRQALSESRSLGRSVEVEGRPGSRVAAVMGGGELLGGLAIARGHALAQAEVRILERAASVMSILLMTRERAARYEHREVNAFMSAVLGGSGPDDRLALDAPRLGLGPERPLVLLVIEEDDAPAQRGAGELRQLLQGAAPLIGGYDGRAIAIAPAELTHIRIGENATAADRDESGVTIAVSKPFQALDQARLAYRHCLLLLRLAGRLELGARILREEAFGLFATLFDGQGADDIRAFVNACIGPIKARDQISGFSLSRTVLAYLDHGHSVRRTAEYLDVHLNTVRQRLEIATALAPRWSDPDQVLQVHAALRMSQLMDEM